jgi:hypothetical protein
MRHSERDAAQVLRELRADHSEAEYVELMWAQRYPKAFPKSSPGWPFRGAAEAYTKHIRIVK